MHAPIKYVEKGLAVAANGAWVVFNGLNKIKQRPAFTPKWSDKPLLKSYRRRSRRSAGRARPTRSARRARARRGRRFSTARKT